MAWTDPRTWSVGEVVTAAQMNTHVRDNLNSTLHLLARKTADQSVTSSTVLVNDTHLALSVAANEVWHIAYVFTATGANATGDIKVAFTFPTGGDIRVSAGTITASGGGTLLGNWQGTTSPTATVDINLRGATTKATFRIEGHYVNAGTAGSLTLQWAQNTSSGTATTLYTHSTLWGAKLA